MRLQHKHLTLFILSLTTLYGLTSALDIAHLAHGQQIGNWTPLPGNTRADSVLQQDAWNMLIAHERGWAKPCKDSKVVNTEVVEPPLNDVIRDPWIERWTVDRCGREISYKVTFTPDPDPRTGTLYMITPEFDLMPKNKNIPMDP
jgi:hypothetical protein